MRWGDVMVEDPKGYYARLGLEQSASAAEIKAAYRKRAKQLHPDMVGGSAPSAEFLACQEAYEILGNPQTRAEYDSSAYQESDTSTGPLDLIHCSRCLRATAQPRSTVYRHVVSVVLTTITTPVQGIFCADCGRKEAIKASVISGLFGWWGVPWGPVLTIKEIVRNGQGGERQQDVDDRLTYYNALAFASRGNLPLAHAIARQLRGSRDEKLGRDSVHLVSRLEQMGVSPNNPPLRNGWRNEPRDWVTHGIAAAGLPLIFLIAVFASSQPRPSYAAYPNSVAPPIESVASATAPPLPINVATPEPPPPTCEHVPENGHVFERDSRAGDGHRLTIRNGGSTNAIVKIRDASTGRVAASFYVSKSQTASISDLPNGKYKLMYAGGGDLNEACDQFISPTVVNEFPGTETFLAYTTPTEKVSQVLEYTLYEVPGGTVSPNRIDAAAFDAP